MFMFAVWYADGLVCVCECECACVCMFVCQCRVDALAFVLFYVIPKSTDIRYVEALGCNVNESRDKMLVQLCLTVWRGAFHWDNDKYDNDGVRRIESKKYKNKHKQKLNGGSSSSSKSTTRWKNCSAKFRSHRRQRQQTDHFIMICLACNTVRVYNEYIDNKRTHKRTSLKFSWHNQTPPKRTGASAFICYILSVANILMAMGPLFISINSLHLHIRISAYNAFPLNRFFTIVLENSTIHIVSTHFIYSLHIHQRLNRFSCRAIFSELDVQKKLLIQSY